MYHSIGYIQHTKTEPQSLISLTRWRRKINLQLTKDNDSLILQIIQLSWVNEYATDSIKEKAQTSYGNPNFVRQDTANGNRQWLLH